MREYKNIVSVVAQINFSEVFPVHNFNTDYRTDIN